MSYASDLQDPRWQKMRLEILQRDGWKCVACFCETRPLNVHHTRYAPRGGKPWEVDPSALETLCDRCHESRHFQGDIDISKLTLPELRDFLGWSMAQEVVETNASVLAWHASKQEQAWARVFAERSTTSTPGGSDDEPWGDQ